MVTSNCSCPPDDDSSVIHVERGDGESILEAVLRAVAAKRSVPVSTLPPLYDAVEPDAMEALLDHRRGNASIEIRFSFAGYRVIVSQSGIVRVFES